MALNSWSEFSLIFHGVILQQYGGKKSISSWIPKPNSPITTKKLLAIRIFSIATIVDDCRLMLAAAQRAEWLEHELADLLEKSKSVVKEAQNKVQASELTNQWNRCCIELSIAADQASGKVPNLKALTELKDIIEEMDSLEAPLRAEIEMGRVLCRS